MSLTYLSFYLAELGSLPRYYWLSPALSLSVSATFYFGASPGTPRLKRFASSFHGVGIAIAFVSIFVMGALFYTRPRHLWVHSCFYAVPVVLAIYSFRHYAGPRWMHWLQLLNLVAMLLTMHLALIVFVARWT